MLLRVPPGPGSRVRRPVSGGRGRASGARAGRGRTKCRPGRSAAAVRATSTEGRRHVVRPRGVRTARHRGPGGGQPRALNSRRLWVGVAPPTSHEVPPYLPGSASSCDPGAVLAAVRATAAPPPSPGAQSSEYGLPGSCGPSWSKSHEVPPRAHRSDSPCDLGTAPTARRATSARHRQRVVRPRSCRARARERQSVQPRRGADGAWCDLGAAPTARRATSQPPRPRQPPRSRSAADEHRPRRSVV